MADFKVGQKWISNAEPELGMGQVSGVAGRTVRLHFEAADEDRTYARKQAPLTRVKFNPGDVVDTRGGISVKVNSVADHDGILIYRGRYNGTDTAIVETELDSNVRFSKPEDRLFAGQIDDNRWFNLRYHSRVAIARLAASPSRGLYGPRVSLIPHQFYIASEVAARFAPRVLLADEVGLGKTIEAGLIMHQQLQTGRAGRILLLVPPALTFQWFVEMIRRFNLTFTVMDDDRCQQIETDNGAGFNPFDAQQLMLASLDLFTRTPERLAQALASTWDLIVVDEAHHLRWTPAAPSVEYAVVDSLSRVASGLLLLTATPEQLGRAGHFARLRLLDPDRFHDYDAFIDEEARFATVADKVSHLIESGQGETDGTVRALLDQHGTGRVLFRNVRSSVAGFPKRIPHSVPLEGETDLDQKIPWLIELLQDRPADKFLVICAAQETAITIERSIREAVAIRTTLFHEGMDLISRDRAASYFAETDRGAQVMVCSEIGSEGRNFQFASNLVLFDLPPGPDLLEQRIGRLDRIGQQRDVHLHIPYLVNTVQADVYRWFAEGVEAFSRPNPVAQGLYDELAGEIGVTDIDALIDKTTQLNRARRQALNRGRDRLLELNSHRPAISSRIVSDVAANEGGAALEAYMEMSFDAWGLESDLLSTAVHSIKPTESMRRHFSVSLETLGHYHYPELPEEGIQVTYDRNTALAREDVVFLTWESPVVQQALDVVTSDVIGSCALIAVRHPSLPSGTLLLETLHVVDCVAPTGLSADRFLPPLVIRSLISPRQEEIGEMLPYTGFDDMVLEVHEDALQQLLASQSAPIRQMLGSASDHACRRLDQLRQEAVDQSRHKFDNEIARLQSLRVVNPAIRPEEIEHLIGAREATLRVIGDAGVRLDAIRIIVAA